MQLTNANKPRKLAIVNPKVNDDGLNEIMAEIYAIKTNKPVDMLFYGDDAEFKDFIRAIRQAFTHKGDNPPT
jgi:hypothetical protein